MSGKDQSTPGGSLLGLSTSNFVHTTGVRRSRAKLLNPLGKVGFAGPVKMVETLRKGTPFGWFGC